MTDPVVTTETPVPEPTMACACRAGVRTTEFWASIGTITPLMISTFQSADWKIQMTGIIGASLIAVAYIVTRASIKKSV